MASSSIFDNSALVTIARNPPAAREKASPTWVYVVGMPSREPPVKIGISCNPDFRVRELQCGSPVPLVVHYSMEVGTEAERLEEVVHRALYKHRIHGEWFNVTPEAAVAVLAQLWLSPREPELVTYDTPDEMLIRRVPDYRRSVCDLPPLPVLTRRRRIRP